MANVTGDRDAVRKLMEDTVRQMSAGARVTAGAKVTAQSMKVKGETAGAADIWRGALARVSKDELKPGAVRATGITAKPATEERSVATPYAPRDKMIALFQSAMDEYLGQKGIDPGSGEGKGKAKASGLRTASAKSAPPDQISAFYAKRKPGKAQAEGLGDKFSPLDPGWIEVVIEKTKVAMRGKHPFVQHAAVTDLRFAMADRTTIAIVGDWGGGNEAAQKVAKQIQKLAPDHVIHLGDVYYAGTPKEVQERFLKYWPTPAAPGRSFALNSNHEMYSGGYGYFDTTLKKFGQPASYFNLSNANWQFIGLDTGYDEHDLHEPQAAWLAAQLGAAGKKSILLSHHQLFSAYENTDASHLDAKVGALLPKVYGWIWGHEHLAVVYKPCRGIKAVCLGNGCFPYDFPKNAPSIPVEWIDKHALQDPFYPGGHTFALMKLDGARIYVDFIDEDGKTQYRMTWE